MEANLIANEQLLAQIRALESESQFMSIDDSMELAGQAMPDAINRFDIAMQGNQIPSGNINAIKNNLSQAENNLINSRSPEAVALGQALHEYQSNAGVSLGRLDSVALDMSGTLAEGKFADFVSVVKRRMERIANVVAELSAKPDFSQKDLMHIQYEVMQMGIVLDVASKVGDKGSQALQTLFRDK